MVWRRDARVCETSTSTGTGTITLAGAYDSSYRAFSSVCSTGDTFKYVIVGSDGTWERGLGTYSAANTLTRTTVQESSNANAAVSFAASSLTIFMDIADRLADVSNGNQDINIDRNAANVLEINNGTPGSFADLKLRAMTLTGAVSYAGSQAMRVYTGMTGTWSRGASASATYSRALTTVTVTHTAHGFSSGDYIYFAHTSGTAADGWYSITVSNSSTYTLTTAASGSTSGNATIYPPIIVTVTAHGLTAGTSYPISFADPRPGSQVLVNVRYAIRQVTTNTFQLDGSAVTGNGATSAAIGTGVAGSSGTVALPFGATYTYSKPTGLVAVKVTVIGGGGQGKCSTGSDSFAVLGDSGGMAIKYIQASSLAANETITVGAGGYTTASGGGAGQTGGTSSFGSWCSATGGNGGGTTGTSLKGAGVGGDLNFPSVSGRNSSANLPFGGAFQGYGQSPEAQGNGIGGFGFGAAGTTQADATNTFLGGHGASGVVIVEEIY